MKKYFVLMCMLLPLAGAAQPAKKAGALLHPHAFSSRLQQHLESSIARTRLSALRQPHAISRFILTPTPPQTKYPVLQENLILSRAQRKDWLNRYQQTLEKFEQFKKESSSFLYYQSIPLEAREMSLEEKRLWLNKIFPLYNQVLALYLNTQKDAALKYALEYLRYGLGLVDPFFVSTLPAVTKPYATPFDLQTFLLYPQESLPEPYLDLENKHIVIINDDKSLLEHFERFADMGLLFPEATLHTHGDALQFLLWMKSTPTKPDIIFTDIQLGESNGYYIAQRLRESDYKGGIIALTSYAETDKYARQLAQAGFDGMVSLDDYYYSQAEKYARQRAQAKANGTPLPSSVRYTGASPIFLRLTQAAQVYLRRQHP